ncbi:MAG: hypothetical protein FWD53_10555 [Phycisphaerales bacterium]|nr:hypothetical protein [Phycisphaerales bacterium]
MEDTLALANREQWAQSQFAQVQLGDLRRTRRLVKLTTMMAGNTSGSIPQQTGSSADMKAACRLFDADDVTHVAVCQPHFDQTRHVAGQTPMVFLLQDTMPELPTHHARCSVELRIRRQKMWVTARLPSRGFGAEQRQNL